ncbi:MAG: hypothetical protein GY711_12430 [bacterium]|nr:hypothetical protein [bacterium]
MQIPFKGALALALFSSSLAGPLCAQTLLTVEQDPPGVRVIDVTAGVLVGERVVDLTTAQPPLQFPSVNKAIVVNSEIWVSAGAHVYRYDSAGNQLSATGPFIPTPGGLDFDGTSVWVAGATELWQLALDGSITGAFPTMSSYNVLAWNGQLLVSNLTFDRIDIYDTNGQFVSVFASGPVPSGSPFGPDQLAELPNGNILVEAGIRLFEFDASGGFVAEYEAGLFEQGVAPLDDGRFLVTLYASVVVFDPASGESITVPGLDPEDFGDLAPFGTGSGAFQRYCGANPNSTGQSGQVGAFGTASVSSDSFSLHATRVPRGFGFFFYGPNLAQVPWGDGVLCTGPFGLNRILPGVQISAAGVAVRDVPFASLPPGGAIVPGSTWSFQFVFRDTAGGPAGFNATDAVRLTFEL